MPSSGPVDWDGWRGRRLSWWRLTSDAWSNEARVTKYRFSEVERYAVYTVHGAKCYMCTKPLDLVDCQVDHVLPESLLDDPELFSQVRADLGRGDDFEINSYANWLPACGACNRTKSAYPWPNSGWVLQMLEKATRKAPAARAEAARLVDKRQLGALVNKVMRLNEQGALNADALTMLQPLVDNYATHLAENADPAVMRLSATLQAPLDQRIVDAGAHQLAAQVAVVVQDWSNELLDQWEALAYDLLEVYPRVRRSRLQLIIDRSKGLLAMDWPTSYPLLAASFDRWRWSAGRLVEHVNATFAAIEGRPDLLEQERLHKASWDPQGYHQLLDDYLMNVALTSWLVGDLTRSTNLVIGAVRREVDAAYRFGEGFVLIGVGNIFDGDVVMRLDPTAVPITARPTLDDARQAILEDMKNKGREKPDRDAALTIEVGAGVDHARSTPGRAL
ncbi:hypothetical protein acdb102_42460 [Acidothermaceae bacterium B102]|nr:hypothetical protein acdb102_42460 [Acidothermaceae bacterium B102]